MGGIGSGLPSESLGDQTSGVTALVSVLREDSLQVGRRLAPSRCRVVAQ